MHKLDVFLSSIFGMWRFKTSKHSFRWARLEKEKKNSFANKITYSGITSYQQTQIPRWQLKSTYVCYQSEWLFGKSKCLKFQGLHTYFFLICCVLLWSHIWNTYEMSMSQSWILSSIVFPQNITTHVATFFDHVAFTRQKYMHLLLLLFWWPSQHTYTCATF